MKKNKEFFNGKTWIDIFQELKFEKYLTNLEKRLKNKKIVIYGAGIMFDCISNNFDISRFNIQAIADKKFENQNIDKYKS